MDLQVTLVIDVIVSDVEDSINMKAQIAEYLNTQLFEDPEFFGGITEDNIVKLEKME